jgi:hypothetical protein
MHWCSMKHRAGLEEEMRGMRTAGMIVAGMGIVATAACGNKTSSADRDLARDITAAGNASSSLELAPRGGSSQTVVSAIEAGPTAAPEHAVRKPVVKPVTHPAPLRAAPQQPAPAPSASVVQSTPAPQRAPAAEPALDPKNVPPLAPFPDAQGKGRDRGAGAEGQIFQHMPWIRP